MALDFNRSAAIDFVGKVEGAYAGLIRTADAGPAAGQEPTLGGKLFYAGELDETGRALVVAGNVAGAATLAATSDLIAQKQAVRDGVVDFLVTSLDEALRILKNEIRKRETVAVCVGAAPDALEREMLERGVLPDIVRPDAASAMERTGPHREGMQHAATDSLQIPVLVVWSVASAPAHWLPKLDAIALDCLEPDAWPATRWLRLAPRYLGRLAHGVRSLHADRQFAARFIERVRERVQRAEIGVLVEIRLTCEGECEEHRFSPPGSSERSA